jgi:hypothetical protein
MGASVAARPPFDWPGALKDAGMVAGVVVLLTLALVGARIQDTSGGPPLAYRFDDVVAAAEQRRTEECFLLVPQLGQRHSGDR